MDEAVQTLTEKERETLRLLLAGYDAKSIALELDLSVHTINDRLREARRKLGVSSSREAARRLARAEDPTPKNFARNEIGVGSDAADRHVASEPPTGRGAGQSLAWLGGGMFIMSLIIAAILVAPALYETRSAETGSPLRVADRRSSDGASKAEGASAARTWLTLVDSKSWAESWRESGGLFRSRISSADWASTIQPVRQPLGKIASRTLGKVTRTGSLPGAPPGDYQVLEFQADFASRKGAVETVVLAREPDGWKVVGYFIR